ncbi:ComF family protein [Streptomyces sp. NPDC050535]|uniref:ComF family protein n=1 Tax=Streptomyces sp. NPDC050535 TaxID=3365626 RepID=UPI0037ACD26F
MRGWWQDLTDLVLPAECGGCGRPRTVLCPECRAVLTGAAPSRVRPVPEPAGLPVVHAAVPYEDEVRAVLLAHKERGVLPLAGPLGGALAGAVRAGLGYARLPGPDGPLMGLEGWLRAGNGWLRTDGRAGGGGGSPGTVGGWSGVSGSRGEQGGRSGVPGGRPGAGGEQPMPADEPGGSEGAGPGTVLLVPVPSSRRAVRARGHDPARRIALAAAGELRRTGTPARVLAVLRQRRAVADQSGLNSRQRLDNLAGALEVAAGGERPLAGGGRIVLVDDLMTTGASLTEAARAVRAAVPDTGGAADAYRAVARAAAGERRPGATTAGMTDGPRTARDTARMARGMSRGRRAGDVTRASGAGDVTGIGEAGVLICAAVVAAPPDSFEINRN